MKERFVLMPLDTLEALLIQYGNNLEKAGKYMTTREVRDVLYGIADTLEKAYGDVTIRVFNETDKEPS